MRLSVAPGLASSRLRVDPSADALVTIHSGAEAPELSMAGSEVRLAWPAPSFADLWRRLFHGHPGEVEIVLHPAVAWELVVHGGLASFDGDLRAGSLTRIEVSGGCSLVEIQLPTPEETVRIGALRGSREWRRLERRSRTTGLT
jgi:hypothetical protein